MHIAPTYRHHVAFPEQAVHHIYLLSNTAPRCAVQGCFPYHAQALALHLHQLLALSNAECQPVALRNTVMAFYSRVGVAIQFSLFGH